MSKTRFIAFILVIGLMSSAFAGSIYLPLRFAEQWGNDPPNSVTATVFKNVTDSVDQVALTRHANAPGLGIWYDSISVDLPGIFIVNYAAIWTSGNDTARVQQMFPFIYDPPTNTEMEARTLPTADYFDPSSDNVTVEDTTAADIARMGNQHVTDSALQLQIFYSVDSVRCTINAHAPHDDNFGGVASIGPGAINVRILALDTANDVSVEGVDITMKLADGTKKHVAVTGDDGWASMTMNAVTYHVLAQHGNYVFTTPACTLTVPADSLRDTVRCYPFDPGSPGDPDLKRIYGWIYDLAGNALEGAIASLTLDVPGDTIPRQTGTGVTIYRTAIKDTTDADGYWSLDVWPTDALTPANCTYIYRAKYNNKYLRYHSKEFAAPNTDTQAITEF